MVVKSLLLMSKAGFAFLDKAEILFEKEVGVELEEEIERHRWKPIATCPRDDRMVELLGCSQMTICVCPADHVDSYDPPASHWREHVGPGEEQSE